MGREAVSEPRAEQHGKICGAMSEQYGHGGRSDVSAPQKFIRLVGCRDPNARARPWVPPRPKFRKP